MQRIGHIACLTLPLTTAILTTGFASTPSTLDEIDALGKRMKPTLEQLEDIGLLLDTKTLELIGKLSQFPAQDIEQVSVYAGVTEDESWARLITLPLAGKMLGASLALSIDDDGKLTDTRLWGRQDVDMDADGAWNSIADQFEYNQLEIQSAQDLPADFSPGSYWKKLATDKSPAASWTRSLYAIRLIMQANQEFYRRTDLLLKAGQAPEASWINSNATEFDRLEAMSNELVPFLGSKASESFVLGARKAKGVMQEMLAVEQGPEQATEIRRVFKGMQGACFSCHNIRNHELGWEGPLVWPGIDERFAEYGVRRDLFRVGMDVWAPAGKEAEAQAIANGVFAGLLLVGSMD